MAHQCATLVMCTRTVVVCWLNASKFGCGLAFPLGPGDSPCAALAVPKVSFSTRNLPSFSGRGPPAHAFRWDLWLWRSLLAARSNWGFCCQESHGVGTWSFRDCCKSGLWSDSSETRYLEPNPFVCFPPNQFRECVDNRLWVFCVMWIYLKFWIHSVTSFKKCHCTAISHPSWPLVYDIP